MTKIKNALKFTSLAFVVCTSSVFAAIGGFVELLGGFERQNFSTQMPLYTSDYSGTTPTISLSGGFISDFDAPIFAGAKLTAQFNSQPVETLAPSKFSGSLAGFIGYRLNTFRPYLTIGITSFNVDIKAPDFAFYSDKDKTTVVAGFMGLGLETKITDNLSILSEWNYSEGSINFTRIIDVRSIIIAKSKLKYSAHSFKIGARYYF